MAATFQGVIEKGQVRWLGAAPPEGMLIVAVAKESPSVEEQIKRIQSIPPDEWRKSFDALRRAWEESEPAELEGEELADEELVKLVHQAREETEHD
jgi:hypothetical protein